MVRRWSLTGSPADGEVVSHPVDPGASGFFVGGLQQTLLIDGSLLHLCLGGEGEAGFDRAAFNNAPGDVFA